MATFDFQIKRNDTSTRTFILKNPDGSRFDLSAYAPGDLSFFFELLTVDPPGSSPSTGVGTFAITDATNGEVQYTFAAADTATAGEYRGEIEALLGADRETFPQDPDYFTFKIPADLGQG